MAPDKRQEILDQLKAAVASFRHCLDLQPDNAYARRDIELVRQWIKYYADRWHTRDREARRQETNLVTFLEFLIEAQKALRESVKALTSTSPADAFAEPKRLQDELQQEIVPLKEKIKAELDPKPSASSGAPQIELKRARARDQDVAGLGDRCRRQDGIGSRNLDGRQAAPAAGDQQAAIDELDKIWDAVIPFHGLLARDLADQTRIADTLKRPQSSAASDPAKDKPSDENEPVTDEIGSAQDEHRRAPVMPRLGPKKTNWRRSRRFSSRRCAGPNCSSSKPRPNWNACKSRSRPTRHRRKTTHRPVKPIRRTPRPPSQNRLIPS